MRWGERLEFVAEAGPGDFIFVPPYVPHQEINAESDVALECVSWFPVSIARFQGWLCRLEMNKRKKYREKPGVNPGN
jgi:oxalate decarboxylase/phosphoglucose isomerase-like protein (cupin superfamily)